MSARYSKVMRRMWNDAKFRGLSAPPPNGQTLWQRLLTGPELTNVPGLFSVGEAALAEALGWPLEGFREAFAEVFLAGMAEADWKARLVWVPKAIEHNPPESPNVVRSWRVALDELPECALKLKAIRELMSFTEALGEGFAKAFAEVSAQALANQEQEQEQDQEQDQEEILPEPGVDTSVPTPQPPLALVPPSPLEPSPTETVFAGYVAGARAQGKRTPVLTDARRKLIRARLRDFSPEMLAHAARGIWLSGWNVEQGRTDLELALRDAGHVERFAALGERGVLVTDRGRGGPVQRNGPIGGWTEADAAAAQRRIGAEAAAARVAEGTDVDDYAELAGGTP